MKSVWLAVLALSAACSSTTSVDQTLGHNDSLVNGPLTLDVKDFLAQPGFFFALPSVIGGTGNIVVQNTRYGSLCVFDVTGNVIQQTNTVALHVGFSERLTSCTAEIRALQYTATITEPAGTYNVLVIHHENNRTDTLQKQTVIVR